MIFTTTATLQGREVDRYLGLIFGDAVLGVNVSLKPAAGGAAGDPPGNPWAAPPR